LSIDGDVVMRGENLGGSGSEKLGEDGRGSGGVAQRNSEKLRETGRRWENLGGRGGGYRKSCLRV